VLLRSPLGPRIGIKHPTERRHRNGERNAKIKRRGLLAGVCWGFKAKLPFETRSGLAERTGSDQGAVRRADGLEFGVYAAPRIESDELAENSGFGTVPVPSHVTDLVTLSQGDAHLRHRLTQERK
jgi:hypothetical protein